MTEPLGLIAGQGALPILVARGMRQAGRRVCCVGLRDQFDPALRAECDAFHVAGVVQLGKWIRLLRRWDVDDAIMVGAVTKTRVHDPLRLIRQLPDWRAIRVWYGRLRHDRRNAAVLAAVADELARNGITLIDSTHYIPDHLASVGVMTDVQPTAGQTADIAFGFALLAQTVELDIGQSMVVRDRDVITVEAVEGTDRMIDRAGELCRSKGWTLLKTSKSDHDMRADVPTIGVGTVERVQRAGGGCIAVGAGRVILVDRPAVISAANRAGIAIVGVDINALPATVGGGPASS
ncbi:MAG: UDP-2,3-diacylglucosamine diphosphatase LpxI [Phycisphaerales bacterium]|nr:UDP-2,3-diacylglucosamine diphosphatase LpxI [Phycisphaerales bacterium]